MKNFSLSKKSRQARNSEKLRVTGSQNLFPAMTLYCPLVPKLSACWQRKIFKEAQVHFGAEKQQIHNKSHGKNLTSMTIPEPFIKLAIIQSGVAVIYLFVCGSRYRSTCQIFLALINGTQI